MPWHHSVALCPNGSVHKTWCRQKPPSRTSFTPEIFASKRLCHPRILVKKKPCPPAGTRTARTWRKPGARLPKPPATRHEPEREHGAACSLWVQRVATAPGRVTFGTLALPQTGAEPASLDCMTPRDEETRLLGDMDCAQPCCRFPQASPAGAHSAAKPPLPSPQQGCGHKVAGACRSPRRCARSRAAPPPATIRPLRFLPLRCSLLRLG